MKAAIKHLICLLMVAALTACGGSGSGSQNSNPVADAGADQIVNVGEVVTLDGSLSDDVDGDELSYFWSLATKPADSTVYLYDEQTVNAKLANTRPGDYILNLVVNDGRASSTAANVTVGVSDLGGLAPVRDPVRPEIEGLMDIGVLHIKVAIDDPDDFSVLDSPTWVTHAPVEPDTGAVTFTIKPKLINDSSTRVGSKVYCHAIWDGDGFWENRIFDDLSTCAAYIDDQDAFGTVGVGPVEFELLETGVTSYDKPTISAKATNHQATVTIHNVSCRANAIDGSTIVDTASIFFAGLGDIAPGRSAISEGVFFNLTDITGLDFDANCTWLER